MLARWLEKERPDVLGKIASFYPVEELAHKLAKSVATPHVKEACLPSFLRLDALAPAVAEKLDARERADLLANGFITKTGGRIPGLPSYHFRRDRAAYRNGTQPDGLQPPYLR